jgi:toxin FitB
VIAIDSSVIIAALAPWHHRHDDALAAINRALSSRQGTVVPAHAILESYSVLTRLPEQFRATGRDVAAALHETLSSAAVVPFPARSTWQVIADLAEAGVVGGAIYDASILKTAENAGATSLLTLNPRDFERFNSQIRIDVP